MNTWKKRLTNELLIFTVGMFFIGISAVLFVCLGKESIWVYHDQLDGELLTYIYQAKYLFKGDMIPEFMNGMGKEALTVPAVVFIVLFKLFSPFYAFLVMQYCVMFAGYIGMYLLLKFWKVEPVFAAISAVLFAYLPLLTVYGLSMFGVPLIIWAFCRLWVCTEKKQIWMSYACILFFGLSSSLILSGYGVLSVVSITIVLLWKRASFNQRKRGILGLLILLAAYAATNFNLIMQVLGFGNGWISHKEEMTISSAPFFSTFLSIFCQGTDHAKDYHQWILILGLGIILIGIWGEKNLQLFTIRKLMLLNFIIAILCAGWKWSPIVALREQIGGVAVWFQFDRLQWICPGIWYAVLGLSLNYLWGNAVSKQLVNLIFKVGAGIVVGYTGLLILLAGNWKGNIQKLIDIEYSAISWQDFYAEDVFVQVKEYIGRSLEEYGVVSLGIYPGAALYNGFYCLDGYSNNYDIEYKHEFRQIIKKELDKSEYLKDYYDGWGNRCYVLSAQIPSYYTIEKGGFYFENLELNPEAIRNLGGEYVLSAAYIQNPEESGLKLLREEPFSTPTSYYQIYLYQVEGEN